MIRIRYGKSYGDETNEYIISYPEGMTVREFIDEWISDEREWGFFKLFNRSGYCEYRYGKIITDPLPDEILDSPIKRVSGSGGWSRSDFNFVI